MRDMFITKSCVFSLVLFSLILLSGASAAERTDDYYVSPELVKSERGVILRFVQTLNKYTGDCEDLTNETSPPAGKLKRCLMLAGELRDQFDPFHQAGESIITKIKNENKWTKKLDENFAENAVKRGANYRTVAEVEREGGFRISFEKSMRALSRYKNLIEAEVKKLEKQAEEPASGQKTSVAEISSESSTGRGIWDSFKSLVKKLSDTVCGNFCRGCGPNVIC